MKKLNPIQRAKYINERYKKYLRSSFMFGNKRLQGLFEKQLKEEDLYKGPYVALNLPYKRGKTLNQLIAEGIVCDSFTKLNATHLDRPLYFHQEEAIRKISQNRSVVITTGTSSGKTESFLYPILNDILKDIEKGNTEVGVRAIFLYPMNALVNDQIARVRKHLANCPEITFGFFTRDTKERNSKAVRDAYIEENGPDIPENELISREEMRKNPPHLLFTNYSMLEYLLIRPNDYAIFSPEKLNNWKYVVMDEAHTYHGSLGIELSMLMRRLTGLVDKKPQFILTSATLGEQGKSDKEIVEFAKNLTSAKFEERDIIFAKRIPLKEAQVQYTVLGSDYIELKNKIKDVGSVKNICNKYKNISASNTNEYLFELLINDRNIYNIYCLLNKQSKTFDNILLNLDLKEEELIALIDLINLANKQGLNIFDLKYHSFVRPLAGAYITLGKEPQLSLTKTNEIDGLKAFEVGNCRFCNSPYIIGKIHHSQYDDRSYLVQNKEVDIYENYGDNENVQLDYFLLENSINEDEVEKDILEEYVVCAKCGCIYQKDDLNAIKCECGDNYLVNIYKINQTITDTDFEAYNNINQCPCCGHRSKSGIVKSLNVGKDEGTALIGQFLYEAIDEEDDNSVLLQRPSLLSRVKKENKEKKKVKQFISFSDSRQQASYAAAFMDSNQTRMLHKRLIWEVITKQQFRKLTIDEMAAYLTEIIKDKDLFQNNMSAHKNAWVAIMVELLRVDGSYDGEGLGIYHFDIDFSLIKKLVSDEEVAAAYSKYNINTVDELITLLQVLFGVFKTVPAINYVKSTLTPEEKKNYLEYRRFDNYVSIKLSKAVSNIRSFIPINNENYVVKYVEKVCKCNSTEAKEFIEILFDLVISFEEYGSDNKILVKQDTRECYQIDVSKYVINNYKNSKFYRCKKCGKITPYNLHGVCVQDSCDGELELIDPDELLKDNFYRNQYKEKKIESIVIKEHTAQLDRKQAKEYQRDFKDGKINILSCSTTFEMGIDIGNLENVFMRNVPPSPANYVQRAGRAGRGEDSSAFVLTYCGTNSHDYTYFSEPEKMISGVIRPPYFNVLNKKIIVRHLMAACLGYFFRKNPDYFSNIDALVFGNGVAEFTDYINSHPKDLEEYIDKKIIPEPKYISYHNFKWFDDMNGEDEKLINFVNTIQSISNEFKEAKQIALQQENGDDIAYYNRQIDNLHKMPMIEQLSKYCVIPKYGFPVDVVELQIYEDGKLNNKYDTNRDLKIAISEYAPDSEVIVDGKKFTSKYIQLPKVNDFTKHYYTICPNCGKLNISVSDKLLDKCKYCGQSLGNEIPEYFIEPDFGFKTGVTKESTRMKPKRSYAGKVSYLGGGIKDDNHLEISNVLYAESSSNDELLVMNKSKFYMCKTCGFCMIAKGKNIVPELKQKHKNYRQYDCPNEILECINIGHRFQTDVVRINIPLLESSTYDNMSKALSFLYAFLEGISIALDIERTDIDGILELNNDTKSYDVLLYDNVAGGAGHVKRLLNKDALINSLKEALVKVSQNCCDENTSCYNCLRNYYNQSYHSRLKRKYAKDKIEELMKIIKANNQQVNNEKRNYTKYN